MKTFAYSIAVIAASLLLGGFGIVRPEVPDNLKAPPNEDLILATHATGVQIYVCQADSGQQSAWVLKAPEAELTDASSGKVVIHHFAGPSWKHADGSLVTGKVIAKQDAPNANAIPWLLLSAVSHTGEGILKQVTTIQRIHTEGGLPPKANDCTQSNKSQETRSTYSADYYFYAPKNR